VSNRTIRVNELLQRELSDILRKRYQTESVAITIAEVRVAPDLRDARVFISKAADIREQISRRIVLKFLPKFEYILDHSAIRGARILNVIDEIEHPRPPEEKE